MEDEATQQPLAEMEPVPARKSKRPALWGIGIVVAIALAVSAVLVATNTTQKAATVVLSQAAARTTAGGTARSHTEVTVSVNGRNELTLGGEGASDFGTKSGSFTITIGSTTERLRSVGGVTYVSVSGVDLPRGAHWVSITAADLKITPDAKAATGTADPRSGLQFLSAVDGNPRILENTQVDGVDVTHYAFSLNLRSFFQKVAKASDELSGSSLASSLEQLDKIVDLSALPGEAWIDDQGRVRKFQFTIEASAEGEHTKSVDSFSFSHFDEPVSVELPSASDTVPFRDVPDFFSRIASAAATNAGTATR
jgi:hypothetical protein